MLFFLLYLFNVLPSLNIDTTSISIAGCSHAADFAHQFHIAFSSIISASCIFAGQPYHCAVTRFPKDQLVPQETNSDVPICEYCPENSTLIYDHCKNHPEWVDIATLVNYPRRKCSFNSSHCIDNVDNLLYSKHFLFRGTYDKCYAFGSVTNIQLWMAQLVQNPVQQIKLVNNLPFPHTMPINETAYYNESGPAMYDGPGECLRFIYNSLQPAAIHLVDKNVRIFNATKYIINGTGLQPFGYIYLPTECYPLRQQKCKLVILPNRCHSRNISKIFIEWAKWAEPNNIVLLQPCVGGYVNITRYPNANEIQLGLLDVYGQLGDDYALQSGPHMNAIYKMIADIIF